ncbi:response regulator [Paraburkholderia bryophila]|uniref:response regulator n=1 Tax=Paraburkholderia bryophila TaxID=420952 RepID=UPI00234BADE2|nr:response regulator [Paraburkholderia bryophila]WCM23606.1 response regulator [Paraburkholderia bryophila]
MTETLLDDDWVVLVGNEISPLKEREQTLTEAHRLALHEARSDVLTSLPNRRQILDSLSTAIKALPDADASVAIVLIDVNMPDISGFRLADQIRQRPALRALKLVALTGDASSSDREAALSGGFDYHLAKPVDMAALTSILASTR